MSEDTSQPVEANSGPVTDAATAAAAAEIAPAPEVVSPEADPAAATDAATDASGAVRNLFGALDADQRIRTVVKQNERTLWAGAAAVTLIYVGIIALQVMQLSPAELAEMAKRKRGQDAPELISVELVPDPDKTSKTQKWQEGQTAAQNPEQPPQQYQPPQVASLQQPQLQEKPVKEDPKAKEEAKSEDEAKPEEDAPKAEEEKQFGPTLPDLNTLVDAAAADLDRKIKDALERKKQQQQRQREQRQAAAPGGALQIRGTGASGRSDPFSRSVIAALMKTRPGPFALWGRVLVSFQISEIGAGRLRAPFAVEREHGARSGSDQRHPQGAVRAPADRPVAGRPHLHHRLHLRLAGRKSARRRRWRLVSAATRPSAPESEHGAGQNLKTRRGVMRVTALASVACGLLSSLAYADGVEAPPKLVAAPSGWAYQFTPYGWVPWVSGDAVVRGRSFSVDVTPAEVIEDLRFAWMSYQQAKNGPLTLFADVIYADEASGGSFFRSRTFSPHVAGSLGASLSDSYRYWTVEAGGTYEIASWNSHGARYATPDTEVELLAGGRYWRQEINVGVALAGTLNIDGLVISGDRAIARSGTHRMDRSIHRRAHPLPAGARRGGDRARRHRRLRRGQQVLLAGARHLQLADLHARADADRRLRRLARAAGRLRDRRGRRALRV